MRFRAAVLVFLTVAGGGVACGGQSSDVKPERCAPVDPVSMAGVGAESLEGDYELVLVATVGDSPISAVTRAFKAPWNRGSHAYQLRIMRSARAGRARHSAMSTGSCPSAS